MIHPFNRAFDKTFPRTLVGSIGGVAPAVFTLQSNGLLFRPSMTSLADWDNVEAPWAAVTRDAFLSEGMIDRTVGDARYDFGRRNPTILKDGNDLYCLTNDYPATAPSLNYITRSTDMGRTWIEMGQTSEANAKIAGGSWAGCACPGSLNKWGSDYHFHRVLTDTTGGFPPYSWDIWSATELQVLSAGKYGNWSAVRNQPAGTGWAETSLLPGATLLHSGTYYHFAQSYAAGWTIGIMSGSSASGPFTQLGATALFDSTNFPASRQPENPRCFFHPGLGKFVMLVNLVNGDFTDSSAVIVGTSDPTNWTGASIEIFAFVSATHGTRNIGTSSHLCGPSNELIYNEASNDILAMYDTDAISASPGWHIGRRIVPATLRYSAGEYTLSGGSFKTLKKTVSHTDVCIEADVKFTAASGNSMGFQFRMTGANGYAVAVRDNATVVLYDAAYNVIEIGTGTGPTLNVYNRVKILAVGTSIKVWLNGVLQVNVTNATYASGTSVWVYMNSVAGSLRNVNVSSSDSITITGLSPRQVIALRDVGNFCSNEIVANGAGVATGVMIGDSTGLQAGSTIQSITTSPGDSIEITGVVALPVVTSGSVIAGFDGIATCSMSATGASTYRWQKKESGVWRNIVSSNANPFIFNFEAQDSTFLYRGIASNANGSIATEEITFALAAPPVAPQLKLHSIVGVFVERTAPTTLATIGDRVGTWRDSTNSFDFASPNDSNRGVLNARGLLTDVTSIYMENASISVAQNKSAFTLFTEIGKSVAGSANNIAIRQIDVLGVQWYNGDVYVYAGTGSAYAAGMGTLSNYLISVVFDGTLTGNANRLKMYIDGVQQTLTFAATIPASTANTAGLIIGDAVGSIGTAPWVGWIKNIMLYDTALSSVNRAAIEDYLGY